MDVERWKPVPGWEGLYDVSTFGRVRRLAISRGTSGGVLTPAGNGTGYLKLTLCRSALERSQLLVHRLVLFAFVGPCPTGCEANHKNGNKLDNRPENLEWVTPKENQRHRYEVLGHPKGTAPEARFGTRHPHARFTDEVVREMRRLYAAGWTQRAIAVKFGTVQTTVSKIVRRELWPHVV